MQLRNNALRLSLVTCCKAAALTAATLAAGGCEYYMDRRDTATRVVGDSVAFNKATQTIDRWPEASKHDRWQSDGERGRLTIERFRNRIDQANGKSEEKATSAKAEASAGK
jgi:hypothetical protein